MNYSFNANGLAYVDKYKNLPRNLVKIWKMIWEPLFFFYFYLYG